MLFAIASTDRGGPLPDRDGRPGGSLPIVGVEGRAVVEGYAPSDPCASVPLLESTRIRALPTVLEDEARVH